jgi:hypothetical protein
MKRPILVFMAFVLIASACKNEKKEREQNPNLQTEVSKTKENQTTSLKGIEKLFMNLESDIQFGKTTPEELRKHYDIGTGDDYGNYFVKGSDLDESNELFYNFSFENGKLAYITFKASNKPLEIETYLTTKFGNSKILSEEIKDRKDWSQSSYNIVFWNRPDWELNIEPKDYSPGY